MDCITIKKLTFHAFHGVFPHERDKGNRFEVDLHIWRSLQQASESDSLEDTCDYGVAGSIVSEVMNGPSVHLLETLLYKIGDRLTEAFSEAEKIEVVIRKIAPPMDPVCDYSEVRAQWPKL